MARGSGQIRLEAVTKQYGGRMVINDLTLDLIAGEIFGLVGPNGAGKTTLFKLIAGMIQPDVRRVASSTSTMKTMPTITSVWLGSEDRSVKSSPPCSM